MKTKLSLAIAAVVALGLSASPAWAGEKEVTVKGDAKCAKCALKETDSCQTVIQTQKEGKKETYYVASNEVGKKFHHQVCQGEKKVVATGEVTEKNGKKEIKLTKIEPVTK